jgi:hypothetical protein
MVTFEPDAIDNKNNLIYDLKTMTNSRLKDKKDMIDAIAIGGLCQPLIFGGIDFAKAPDYAGRATYWVVPFKYKTAGFKFCDIRSDFGGLVWRFQDYYGINLKDLPINYNFEMAKKFYKNWSDELLSLFKRHFKLFINGLYGKYMYNACNIPSSWYSPSVYQDMVAWLSERRYYIISARGAGKTRIR